MSRILIFFLLIWLYFEPHYVKLICILGCIWHALCCLLPYVLHLAPKLLETSVCSLHLLKPSCAQILNPKIVSNPCFILKNVLDIGI